MEGWQEYLARTYFDNTLAQYLAFFGCVLGGILLGRIVHFLFKHKLRELAARTESRGDDDLLDIFQEPIVLVLVAGGLFVGKEFLTLSERAETVFREGAQVLVAVAVTWLLLRMVDVVVRNYLEPLVENTDGKLDDQVLPLLRKSTKAIIAVLAVIVVLSNMGYDILSVLAGLGIGGLALALAAQDTLKNVVGGLTIFWDKPFQIQDWVVIGGHEGEVSEIGMRSTRLKTIGGTHIVIPNSKVADTPSENFSTRTERRQVVVLGVTYDTSADGLQTAIDTIYETLSGRAGIRADGTMVRFVNFGAYSLDLEVVYWITDMENWRMVIHDTHMALKRSLDEASVELAFPTETHYLLGDSAAADPGTGASSSA
jgi:MscS family membrane protein